ncbi:WXG100 family type VII secretion target [Microbacterium sp.]|uniref:WXG100 family type VII secretion target n=1 Tax=Microbacterium sp. TaxID=51671 RepID=UPI003F972A99
MIKVAASTAVTLKDIQTGLEGISELLEKLDQTLQVLERQWNGEAREAYALAQREWNANMGRLNAIAASARGRALQHTEDIGAFDVRRRSAWTR